MRIFFIGAVQPCEAILNLLIDHFDAFQLLNSYRFEKL